MSFLSSVNIEVGTESNPMSSLSELDNSPSEFVTVFTDLGGQLSTPMEVEVLKGETGGPFMVVSFDFQGGGWDAANDTLVANTSNSNDFDGSEADRFGRTNNLGLGNGNGKGADNFHPTLRVPDRGGGFTQNSSTDITEQIIDYYNHGTNSKFSDTQEEALRDFVSVLSDDTPHAGVIVDSDGGSQGLDTPWDSNSYFSPAGGGHAAWIEEPSGDKALVTPSTDNSDEHHAITLWTHNSNECFPSSGNEAGTPAPPNEGLNDLNSRLLIPSECRLYTFTGGGPLFGTPYSPNISIGDNFRNNRVFFLVRD